MLDKCISLCAKFPDEPVCSVCARKAGIPPKAKRSSKATEGSTGRLRQRYENRTYKYMRVRPNARQAQMRMPQALRDFTRAHIARK